MEHAVFTVVDLAKRWHCSVDVIYDMLRTGLLRGFKIGTSWRISAKAVDEFENKT